jgi:hypothetical protein
MAALPIQRYYLAVKAAQSSHFFRSRIIIYNRIQQLPYLRIKSEHVRKHLLVNITI